VKPHSGYGIADEDCAPGTVDTAPERTIDAVADHGVFRDNTIHGTYDAAAEILGVLDRIGIDQGDVFDVLETEAVQKIEDSWTPMPTTAGTPSSNRSWPT